MLRIATFKEADRAIFSEMHWQSAEARSDRERGGVTQSDGGRRAQQLVNVADQSYISQGIKSLLSCYCSFQIRFCETVSNAFLLQQQRKHAACWIRRNFKNFVDESWDLKMRWVFIKKKMIIMSCDGETASDFPRVSERIFHHGSQKPHHMVHRRIDLM